jgi:hypothetical protein
VTGSVGHRTDYAVKAISASARGDGLAAALADLALSEHDGSRRPQSGVGIRERRLTGAGCGATEVTINGHPRRRITTEPRELLIAPARDGRLDRRTRP